MANKVLIIYTGGTIGMTNRGNGYVPDQEFFQKELEVMPDLHSEGMPEWDLYQFANLLDSSDMTVEGWNQMGQVIFEHYDDYDGFVILHGTDTMAYSASALSFMLENLNKPVIFTGSQIPLCEIRSDGRDNLITAMLIAASKRVKEVAIYFGHELLRGNRAIKYSADGLIAFVSPNYPILAKAGIAIEYNEAYLAKGSEKKLNYRPFEKLPIAVIKVFPGIQFDIFETMMTSSLKGIVIETFGAGNIPAKGNELLPIIKKAFSSGTIVIVCSQCPQGSVSLGAYGASQKLKEAGAVSGIDITTEAAVAKLYYLFSKGLSRDDIKTLMGLNLRGEMKNSEGVL